MSDRITFKELKPLIEVNVCTLDQENLIGILRFTYKGTQFTCQWDSDNSGLYGFSIVDPKTFFNEN